jgi:hypothetical protein
VNPWKYFLKYFFIEDRFAAMQPAERIGIPSDLSTHTEAIYLMAT